MITAPIKIIVCKYCKEKVKTQLSHRCGTGSRIVSERDAYQAPSTYPGLSCESPYEPIDTEDNYGTSFVVDSDPCDSICSTIYDTGSCDSGFSNCE